MRLVLQRGVWASRGLVVHMSMAIAVVKGVWCMEDLRMRSILQTLQVLLENRIVVAKSAQVEPILRGQVLVGEVRLAMLKSVRHLRLQVAVSRGNLLMKNCLGLHNYWRLICYVSMLVATSSSVALLLLRWRLSEAFKQTRPGRARLWRWRWRKWKDDNLTK